MLWISFLILGTFVPSCLATEAVIINLDVSKSHAHAGDNITFVCRISNMPEDGYMFWAKSIIGINDVEVMDMIGGGENKLPPYDAFPKYQLQHTESANDHYYTLILKNVSVQETGHYICSYREVSENFFEMESLSVYDDVDQIRLYLNTTNEEITSENGIQAEAGDPLTLEINVFDTIPAADVKVYVGDNDVTDNFKKSYHVQRHCEGTYNKLCPLYYTQRTTAVSQTFMFKPEYRDLKLLVSAEVPGSGFERVNVTYPLVVTYTPIYKCFSHHTAKIGEPFELQCKVRGHPMPESFYWIIPQGDMNYTIDARHEYVSTGMYDAKARHLADEENTWLVSLIINQVGPENFKNYYLQAGNDLGNTTQTMELTEDIPPTQDPNAGSMVTSHVLVLLVSVVASIMKLF